MKKVLFMLFSFYAFSMVAQNWCTQPFVLDTIDWSGHPTPPLVRFFDTHGKEYDTTLLKIGLNGTECEVGMFTLHFVDGATPFFFSTAAIPLDEKGWVQAADIGELRRIVSCQAFADVSDFLYDIAPNNLGRVHISIGAGTPGIGANPAAMTSNPIWGSAAQYGSLILDNEVHKTILSGANSYLQYPTTATVINTGTQLFHAFIEVSEIIDWHYRPDTTFSNNPPQQIDYYTAMLHEAIHCLGVIKYDANGAIPINFSRYEKFLVHNDPSLTPLLFQNAGNWDITAGFPLWSACNSVGSLNFSGNAVALQEVAESAHHLGCMAPLASGLCPYAQPNDFVMTECTDLGPDYIKRHPNEIEKDILCDLGYSFNLYTNGLPEFGSNSPSNVFVNHPYQASCSPPCNVVGMCDSLTIYGGLPVTIFPLTNDINGTNAYLTQVVAQDMPIPAGQPNSGLPTSPGWIASQTNNSITFQPNGNFTGWVVISYVPKCYDGEQDAGTTFIFIFINNCDCPPNGASYQVGYGGGNYPVNTISTSPLFPSIPANSCVQIKGELHIDASYAFPQGTRLIMDSQASIVVDSLQTLTLNPESNLYACDSMWRGISIRRGATLKMSYTLIEDADTAVRAMNTSSVYIRNSRFHTNFWGLMYRDASFTLPQANILGFADNSFDCTGTFLLPPYPNYTTSLAGIADIGFPLIISQHNDFRDMRSGILASNATLSIQKCTFKNINGSPGMGIAAINGLGIFRTLQVQGDGNSSTLEFDSCHRAIWARRVRSRISYCNMEKVDEGIHIQLSTNSSHTLNNNTIACKKVGIDMFQNAPTIVDIRANHIHAGTSIVSADAGIRIQDGTSPSNSIFVYDNVVDMDFSTVGYSITNTSNLRLSNNIANLSCTQPNTGFYLNLSPGALLSCNRAEAIPNCNVPSAGILLAENYNTTLQCNHTENGRWGLYFANYTSTNPLLTIRGNEIGTHETGLRYTNSVNNLSQSLQGNLWTGTYSNAGAVHDGANIGTNVYEVNTLSSSPTCPPSINVNGTFYSIANGNIGVPGWFILNNIGNTFNCSNAGIVCNSNISTITGGGSTSNDYELIGGKTDYETYPEESEWSARRDLYNRILQDSTLLQDSLLSVFFETYQDSSEGQYQEVSYQMNEAFRLQPVTEEQLEMLHTQLQTWGDSLIILDSLLQTSSDTNSYLPLVRNVRNTIDGLQIQYESILQGIETLRNNTFDYLQTENGLLPSNELYEQNEQTINEIYLSTIARGTIDFTQQQVDDLANIANQCPLSGGNAVYKARSLYTIISGNSYYNDELLCMQAGVQYKQAQSKQIEKAYEIYPNPTDDVLQIQQLRKNKGNGSIEIRDSYNRFLLSKSIAEDENAWEINTSSLASGVYFLTINRSGQDLYVQKVIIIR